MTLRQTIPALPVRDTAAATKYYVDRLGFELAYGHNGVARLRRDAAEIHLWQSDHEDWRDRQDFQTEPVCSGAESFLAGTASCRIEADDVNNLYVEMANAGVLHHADSGSPQDTDFGTREFAVTDQDNNLIVFFRRR